MKANEKLTQRLVQAIEENPTMTWRAMYEKMPTLINANTGKQYQGGNLITLALQTWVLGYESGLFLTFKQAQAKGLKIKKGSKGCYVSFYSPIYKDANGKTVASKEDAVTSFACSKWYSVFPMDCFEESDEKQAIIDQYTGKKYDHISINDIDRDIQHYLDINGIKLSQSEDCTPSYNPVNDSIRMPFLNQFELSSEFYKTFFHEIAHSTGHPSRLDRDFSRNKKAYGNEELIAELTACQLANLYDLGDTLNTSASYLASWIRIIKETPQVLYSSASHADKILAFYADSLATKRQAVA